MPPKRKNKASKAATALPLKTPRTEDTKPGQVRRNSLAATSGRTSRLLPSVPFQMTTRRGAKTASAGPSSASSGSRRSSLNDVAQFQEAPSDFEDERPAKRSRTLTDSGSPQMSNGSLDNKTPMNGTQTPELQKPAPGATSTTKTAGKKRRASDDSTQSSKTLNPRPNGVLTRTQSEASEQQPRRKKRKTTGTPADPADQPPELTDASTAPNSPEQLPDVDGSQGLQNVLPTNGDAPAKPSRRLPGRRRQPHPDTNIEADLRRQLNLKMSYRSLAKVQKTLLEELSNRTIDNLQKDEDYYKKCPEYDPLMAQLKERRDSRVNQIDAFRMHRHEQLDRVRIAEERTQKEQYINRFQDLQDDFLLQCYHQMKRIERERKGEQANATDDEDNVLPPTYTDEPHHEFEDRIGSKFASRSRAYVEADRELEDDMRRKRFDLARIAFVEKDDDADDSIEDTSGGYARFVGPDRTEAIVHYNLKSMMDAAIELDRTPTPRPKPPVIPVIPNAQATDLMMLAELSTQQSGAVHMQTSQQQPQYQEPPPLRARTPSIKQELTRQMSPINAPVSMPLPSQAAHSSPIKASQPMVEPIEATPYSEPNGIVETSKNATPARISTHRIMDILNNDQDVPVFRSREAPPLPQEPSTPSRREAVSSQHNTPSHGAAPPADAGADKPVDQALMDALGGRPSEPPSPPPTNFQPWHRQSAAPPPRNPDEAHDRRDPLQKIRDLLDRKARAEGREPPDRSHYRTTAYLPRVSSMQAAQNRHEVAGYDPTRPSAGLHGAPSSVNPSYPPAARRASQDWERERRMSAPQAQQHPNQSPYSNPPQPHQGEQHRTGPTPPNHNSPYALPPGSLPLPPKPPGPPPVNFRFAHYDPAPPRQTYPPQSPTYPPGLHPPQLGPPPPQYAPSYPSPYQPSYIPPPGSFQAPPPPSNLPPYPPLKIHQYGGQPILPANMAPPPHVGPQMTFVGQQQQQQAFSPQQTQPQRLQYETQREGERPDPQARPRRQYRSYHAPGTQFRSYQGPAEGARRRGG
ncbi:hypothetical protein CC86DRAFT_293360 [Ophiobolus disseminans]|uniref:Uncharacterized protein n=1 Tax=Ophiobolus disseminans TaxID=1469910 RepID=A0A6A6ZYS8_9PLEO|nr:hypothetical protein CC86DRAFT_293360 [Ophiobolus disseminans]